MSKMRSIDGAKAVVTFDTLLLYLSTYALVYFTTYVPTPIALFVVTKKVKSVGRGA